MKLAHFSANSTLAWKTESWFSQLWDKFTVIKATNPEAAISEGNFQTVASQETNGYETLVSIERKVVSLIIISDFDLHTRLLSNHQQWIPEGCFQIDLSIKWRYHF